MISKRLLRRFLVLPFLWVLVLGWADAPSARVLGIEIERRETVLGGRAFGERGAYEMLEGRIHFGFEPEAAANARVSDIALAPVGEDGLVHAWSELLVLQAVDATKRRGTALVEVVNRGRRLALGGLNRGGMSFDPDIRLDPSDAADFGDGFLMDEGLTVVWIGWQADAPETPGSMRLRVPSARRPDGSPVRGLARSDWVVEKPATRLPLGALGHAPHPAADPDAPENVLTQRTTREAMRRVVPRSQWQFDESRTSIQMPSGFKPGQIYELVYVAHDPPVVGLGFAAFRDVVSYLRNDPACPFPAQRGLALGSSQSGRFLRHFLYEGFNRDENGRQAYDGMIINIAGGGRGGFNHRFSHPGRVGNPFRNFFYPGDDFPFASQATVDPTTGERACLLDREIAQGTMPRLFQVNTGYEYWGRVASLVHMSADGAHDLAVAPRERLYHLASAPHYSLPFPPRPETQIGEGIYRGSRVDTSSVQRALLLHMLRWIEAGTLPPATRVPRVADESLVRFDAVRNPVPGLILPRGPHVAYQQDFGPRAGRGIIDNQPPRLGSTYAVRLPQVDALGIEKAGIRGISLRVPIGSYSPWALRTGFAVASDEMIDYLGTFAPFARTQSERVARADSRPSLEELYPDRANYDQQVDAAIEAMIAEGLMLARDREYERQNARIRWDWASSAKR